MRRTLLALLLLTLAACNTVPVAQEVSQTDANQIVAILGQYGISSTSQRDSGGKARYNVYVKRNAYSEAQNVLFKRQLLPRTDRLDELTTPKGFLPNSREMESLRVSRAYALQVEELLLNNPDVLSAKVIVNANTTSGGSAVVNIRHRIGANLDPQAIQQMVERSVPGLSNEGVQVFLYGSQGELDAVGSEIEGAFRQDDSVLRIPLSRFLFGWKVAEDDYDGLALTLLISIVAVFSIGIVIGYWYGFFQQQPSSPTQLELSSIASDKAETPKLPER